MKIQETPCPNCGEAGVQLRLHELPDGTPIYCQECEQEFTLAHVRAVIAAWGPVLKWIDAAPNTDS